MCCGWLRICHPTQRHDLNQIQQFQIYMYASKYILSVRACVYIYTNSNSVKDALFSSRKLAYVHSYIHANTCLRRYIHTNVKTSLQFLHTPVFGNMYTLVRRKRPGRNVHCPGMEMFSRMPGCHLNLNSFIEAVAYIYSAHV